MMRGLRDCAPPLLIITDATIIEFHPDDELTKAIDKYEKLKTCDAMNGLKINDYIESPLLDHSVLAPHRQTRSEIMILYLQ